MASLRLLLAAILAASLILLHATTTAAMNMNSTAATAYEVLEQHGLPRGILPEGVESYVLRPDGAMEVTLAAGRECDFFVAIAGEKYKIRYGATVGGVIGDGSVREVYGVRMQVKFAWLGFNGVRRRSGAGGEELELQVQEFTQSFPVVDMANQKLFLLAMVASTLLLTTSMATVDATDNSTSPSPSSSPPASVYDMLQKFGFPVGILPEGVQEYKFADSYFEVFLAGGDCELRAADKYTIRYSSRIAGSIAAGSITSLDGVTVKVEFVWLEISQVDVDGDQLKLYVGPNDGITQSFPVSDFAVSPKCG
uniref:Uncharacterized protein n=1 Tax=Leersia perrieri TaxID=77586 RepID=A0A0D9XQP7_9ORYZ